jgi:DNA polymerase-1
MDTKKKTLILIDSNALVHRAFHALPPLSKKDGTLTNAVYGYALTLLSVLDKFKPDYIMATFDLKGPTFRHEQYEEYKATRKKAPDELYEQIPMVKELLKAFNIPIYEKQGFEADDIIGTLAKDQTINGGLQKIIVTGDLDTLQLVDEHTKVFTLRKGLNDTVIYDVEQVRARYGLEPSQMIEYKALRGDQSDNIPGVKGIGEKTAVELLLKYHTVDGVYENIEYIASKAVRKKLEEGKEKAYLSRQLATIDTKVPLDFSLEQAAAHDYDKQELLKFLKEMEFFSLAKRLSSEAVKVADKKNSGKKEDLRFEKSIENEKDLPELKLVEIITTEKQLKDLIKLIREKKQLAVYFLADSEKYYHAEVKGAGIYISGDSDDKSYFLPVAFMDVFSELLLDDQVCKFGYNIKFAKELLKKRLGEEKNFQNIQDVQIVAYLLSAGNVNDIEKLIFQEFGAELKYKVLKKGQMSFSDVSDSQEEKEAAEKAFWVAQLWKVYEERLKQISTAQTAGLKRGRLFETLGGLYEKMEKPLIDILAEIEMAGIKVDKNILEQVSAYAQEELKKLEQRIYAYAGNTFNINSPSQLAVVLYEKLAIPTFDIKRGKTGYSTDAEQLAKIREQHPIVNLIEQYRELFKIKTTYTDALPLLVEDDGRIHANFNQAVAATGRLSSSDPNLQNIPKRGELAKLIRKAFVAEKGFVFVAADYSQIDLRAAAHLSRDERMIEAFKTGRDIHRATASWVNGIEESKVTDEQRREAKSLNFGVLYGMGTYGFMRDSGVSRERAESFIKQYMQSFSGLKQYLDETKKFADKYGYVETELGRRRYIPNIKASNRILRNAAERMAINLPVQGLSADIMKLAMIAVEKDVLKKYKREDVKMILQIHDELIFEVKKELEDQFMREVKVVMEGVYNLQVPLVVEVESGKDWSEV